MPRLIQILSSVIKVSELNGLNVKPHSAVSSSDMIEQLTIRYEVESKDRYCSEWILDREFMVSADASCTVWEFKDQIARMMGLSARYLRLTLPASQGAAAIELEDHLHGQTLKEFALISGTVIRAERRSQPDHEVEKAELLQEKFKKMQLTKEAEAAFKRIFDEYKDPATDLVPVDDAVFMLIRAQRQESSREMLKGSAFLKRSGQGMSQSKWLDSYCDLIEGRKKSGYSQLKSFFVRKDLARLCDVAQEPSFEA